MVWNILDTLKQYWYHIFFNLYIPSYRKKTMTLFNAMVTFIMLLKRIEWQKWKQRSMVLALKNFFFLTSSIIQAFCVVSKSRRGYIMCITRAYVVNSSIKWFRWTSANVRNVFDPRDFRWHCSWTHFFALELFFQWLKWQDKDSN